jgi:tetratricopeptide (TPR) repeat protein
MHTDHEVLEALRSRFTEERLAPLLGRLLRVPEAWTALRNPAFLDEVITAEPPSHLTPSHLAGLALGGELAGRLHTGLIAPHRRRAERLWDDARLASSHQSDLFEVALLGLEFAIRTADDNQAIELALNSPGTWSSPLSVAWPALADPEAFLADVIAHGELGLAIQIALTNLPVGEAASYLIRNANGSTIPMLLEIVQSGEPELVRSLSDPRVADTNHAEPFAATLFEAVGTNDSDRLRTILDRAWEDASRASAFIAEMTAEVSRSEGDLAQELESYQRAYELCPSPVRRARTALSLASLDRREDALALLSSTETSTVERIAEATIRAGSEDGEKALDELRETLSGSAERAGLTGEWFETLEELFRDAHDIDSVVKTARLWLAVQPANADAHMQLSKALRDAGDQAAGLPQAELAQALKPASEGAKKLLAESFESAGQYDLALAQRAQLSEPSMKALGDCAIRAKQFDYAGDVVEQMLVEDPGSVDAHVLLGRILASKEESGPARAAFEEAIKLGPQDSAAYRALAVFQSRMGEDEAAGQTLRAATMAYPAEAAAQAALSDWLGRQLRHSEALQAAAEATALEPENIDLAIAHAELQVELGHTDQAIESLRSAARQAPRDWRVRFALAKAYEREGDLEQAAALAPELPDSASPQDRLIAGRISVKAGKSLSEAATSFGRAEEQGISDPSLHYWYGEALMELGRYDEAFDRFSRIPKQQPSELREQSILGMARAALGQGQISLALSTLDDAREQFGDSAKLLALSSRVYQSAKLADKALEMAEQAIEFDRDDPEGWRALGEALAGSGDFIGAMSAIERLSSLDGSATEGWIQLARLAGQAGEVTTARKALAEAIWNGRREAGVLAQAADTLAEMGALESAVRLLSGAIRKHPDQAAYVEAIAKLYENAGDYQQALESWVTCGELRTADAHPWMSAARCAKQLGQSNRRVTLLEQAIGADPTNPGVRHQLAIAYLELGYAERGIGALIEALQESPNDASLACKAAEAALQAGAVRQALGMIGKAQQLAADPGRTQAALAESFVLLQEWDKAEDALAEAIESDRVDARVLSMLAIVRSHQSDQKRSEDALAQAEAATAKTAHEAIWLGRAQARHFKAKQALATLAPWSSDAFAAVEAAKMTLRMADAEWLFEQADAVVMQSNPRDVQLAIKELEQAEIAESVVAPLLAWRDSQQDPARLAEWIADDASGQMGEALVVAHLNRGDLDAALEAVSETREASSSPEWLAVLEGFCQEQAGNAEQARAAWRKATGPILPLAEFLSGRSYARMNSIERAAKRMESAVTAWPNQSAWQHALASVYSESGMRDQALQHYQNAASKAASNPEYQLSLADALRLAGRHVQAEEAYEIALKNGSAAEKAYREAAENAFSLGMHSKALERYERALAMAPSDPVIRIGAARAAQASGDSRAANGHLRVALERGSEMPEVLLGHGKLLTQAGDVRAAVRAFEQALQAGADPAEVFRNQSKLYLQSGEAEKAKQALHSALESEPDDDRLWHDLSMTFESQGDMNAADEAVCEAIRISPLNPEYRLTLARISRRAGNLDRAIEELQKGRQRSPNDPRFPVEIGMVHEDRREYSRALDAYREAIELDTDCLEAFYRAGLLLRTLKAYRRAGEMLKHAAELAPINKDVLHQLAAVRALELVHG